MKQKLFTLLTLALFFCSGAWADDPITVTWLPDGSSSSVTSTAGTASVADILTVAAITKSSDISAGPTAREYTTGGSHWYGYYTCTTGTGSTGYYSKDDYLTFAVTVKDGYTFTPTSVALKAIGIGTGNQGAKIFSTIQTSSAKNQIGKGDSSNQNPTDLSLSTFSQATYEAGETLYFYVHIGSKNANGHVGLRDVVLTGTYATLSTDPSISADNVDISASATGGNIAYTVNNPVVGGAVTAAKKGEAAWLTSIGTESSSPISFTTETNNGAERVATVTLTYTYNTSETVTKDVTITQAAKTYAITYNPGTYGTGSIDAGEKAYGVAFTLSSETFTRALYEQTGWATTDGGAKVYELGGSYTANADIELFPVWEEALYTVTYNVNGGGSCATTSATQASWGAALTLPTPTWAGYTFNGWYNAGTKIGDAGDSYTPTANITLYAKWTDNIEGKLFSYIDGNYGDKFQAFDASGWVTADATGKSKTFTDATTGAQFVVTDGAWDNKTNSISALAKFKKGSSAMSVVIPMGYLATVKILYGAYNTANVLKINTVDQDAPAAAFNDSHTNSQIAGDMTEVTLEEQSGTLNFDSPSSKNIYIARVAVTLTHESISTASGKTYATYVTTNALDFSSVSSNIKAYVAGSTASAGSITFTGKDEVPAGTPILVKTASAGATVNVPIVASADAVGTNYLVAGDGGNVTYDASASHFYYILTSGEFKQANNSPVAVGKAYLALPSAATSNELTINFDDEAGDVTGIATISSKKQSNGEYYNLNGQRVDASHKGIVIVNGKKFFNK